MKAVANHLPCQVCGRLLVPLKDGTSRSHTPGRAGTGGARNEYNRCRGSGYRLARWPVGQCLRHHTSGIWEVVVDAGATTRWADYVIRLVDPTLGHDGKPMETPNRDLVVAHGEYMHRHGWTPVSEGGEGNE